MFQFVRQAMLASLVVSGAGAAYAADMSYPPVESAPPPVVYQQDEAYGGWYIRGDVDYHWSDFRGASYTLYDAPGSSNDFDFGDLRGAPSLGLGVGYQITRNLRTDVTGDYWFKSDFNGQTSGYCADDEPCVSVDKTKFSALLLLANAYVDIGTWHGITPYVGAGIGGAWVKWDDLNNITEDGSYYHKGGKGWRFAYALMAGASYCLTDNLKLDAGYRFSKIEGGKMFDYAVGGGPGYDKGMYNHEVRGGLRYQFGKTECSQPEQIVYEPEPVQPIYK